MKPSVALIGPGRLGQAIGRLLVVAGYPLRAVIGRDEAQVDAAAVFIGAPRAAATDLAAAAGSSVVFLTLPDDQLTATADRLMQRQLCTPEQVLVHCSGLHPAASIKPAGSRHQALSLHPLQTFASPQTGLDALPGTPWSVEGDPLALPLGETLVRDLQGEPFRLAAEHKPLYHAAASVTANYQAALFRVASRMFEQCGFSAGDARRLLGPLFVTSNRNIAELGPETALTGPIARGDVQTVATQLAALAPLPGEFQKLFRILGRQTVATAVAKGSITAETASRLLDLLGDPA